jgi:UDP-2,3-diacylglucosamine pyrophosphatase LpxH
MWVIMIIIADAHIDEACGNDTDFFRMLHALENNDHDVVFLGDIFDLWIALPRYEKNSHRQFLSWCQEQKSHRSIGFIEGNHEYFVAQEKQHLSGRMLTAISFAMVTKSIVTTRTTCDLED